MATKKKAATTQPATKAQANTLTLTEQPGKTLARQLADVAAAGEAGNACTLVAFASPTFGELSITDCVHALRESAKAVNDGDLRGAESTLTAQAAALNSIFVELARRSALNMGEYLDATERYMRLALKAQAQCRATLETLAAIKNPPVVIARQANINHGGQQQVNNGAQGGLSATSAQAGGATESLEGATPETARHPTQRIFSAAQQKSNGEPER